MTPISRPKSNPASAARKQTKKVIALFERPFFLLSGMMPSRWVICFINVIDWQTDDVDVIAYTIVKKC